MKTKQLILALSISVLCFFSCKQADVNGKDTSAMANDISRVLDKYKVKPEKFKVNASLGGEFTSTKGVNYKLKPKTLLKSDGSLAVGDVVISVTEITKISEMILNDMPTNAIVTPFDSVANLPQFAKGDTVAGGVLNSFGEIKIDAEQNGNTLSLKPGSEIDVEIPQSAIPEPIVEEQIPIWDYVPTSYSYTTSGYNHENQLIQKQVMGSTSQATQIGSYWTKPSAPAKVETGVNGSKINFSIPNLGSFKNCDVLVASTVSTTVLGYFTNIYNDSIYNIQTNNGQNIQSNMLFMKLKNQNACVKLYTDIIEAPTGKKGLLSYQNSIPVGSDCDFLAISIKDNKIFAHKKSVIVNQPSTGKNYFGIDFVLQEVSESELISLITSMDNM